MEYFVAAAAMAAAAMWLYQNGEFQSVRTILESTFTMQMNNLAGSVH